jgi:hypothetical protein
MRLERCCQSGWSDRKIGAVSFDAEARSGGEPGARDSQDASELPPIRRMPASISLSDAGRSAIGKYVKSISTEKTGHFPHKEIDRGTSLEGKQVSAATSG